MAAGDQTDPYTSHWQTPKELPPNLCEASLWDPKDCFSASDASRSNAKVIFRNTRRRFTIALHILVIVLRGILPCLP